MTESLWFQLALLPTGWAEDVRISHEAGRISRVETGVAAQPGDEHGVIAVPGLANVHSHAFQRGMAGLAETRGKPDDDFWSWREVMYRFLDRLDPEDVEAIAAQAYAEMLESGFTRVGEFHYLHNDTAGAAYAQPAELADRIVAAAAQTGIGLTLLPVFYAHANFGGVPPRSGQRRFINTIDSFAALVEAGVKACSILPDAVVGVAPHSLRAVTPEELTELVKLAPHGPIHIHAAEQIREVRDCVAWSGQRPVEWLLDQVGLDPRWCLIHATHLTSDETDRLAQSGAVAGLCPITEANLGDGIFPAARFLAGGGALAVGTDSNILIDAPGELRALEYSQRLNHLARNVLATEDEDSVGGRLFRGALAGGAQAMGVGAAGLSQGAALDLVSLDADHPSLVGRRGEALLDAWIFAGRGGVIDRVWRGGRKVVEGGRHRQAEAIAARYKRTLLKVLAP